MTPNGNTDHGYTTATQAARLANLPGRTVRHWARNGKVGTIDTAKGRLVLLRDVQHLAELTRQANPMPAMADQEELPPEPAEDGLTIAAAMPEPLPVGETGLAILGRFAAELAALREERTRLQEERDALLTRALRAEWEAARWRPPVEAAAADPVPAAPWWAWWRR